MSNDSGKQWFGIVASFAAGLMLAYVTFWYQTGERLTRLETKVDLLMSVHSLTNNDRTVVVAE